MVEEEIERSAVDEILKEVKKNVESTTIATIVPGLSNINKRLLSGELVSTLRHPIRRPAIVKNRRFVGLDDDDFSDQERKQKWKKIKDGIGREYDPDAEYIYDARKYFDPDKYRTVCANRRKKADKVAEIETEAERNYEQIVAYYSGYYPYCLPGGFEPLGVPPASEWKHQSTEDRDGSQGPEEVVYERFQGKDHYPPRVTDLYPPRVTEDYPPRVSENYPPRVTEDYPPRVTEHYPPRVTEDYPPKASSVTVTEDYPPHGETYYPPRGITHYPSRGATYYPPRGRDHYLQRGRGHYAPRGNDHYPQQGGEYFPPRGGGRYPYRGEDPYSQQNRNSYRTEGWPSERGVVPAQGDEQERGAPGHGRSPRGGRGAWRFSRGSHYGGGWSGEGRSGWQLEGRRTGFVTDSESDDENRRLYGDTYHDGNTAVRHEDEYKERSPPPDKYNDSNTRARYPRRDTTPQERYPTEHPRDRYRNDKYRNDNDSSSYNRDKDTGLRHRGGGENKESDRRRDNVMGSRDSYLPMKRGRDDENDRSPRDRLYEEIPQKRTRGKESDDHRRANNTSIRDGFRSNNIRIRCNSADARKYIPRGSVSPTNDRRPLARANERQTNLQSSKITKTIKRPTNLISASQKILMRNKMLKDKPSNAGRSQSQHGVQELRKKIQGSSSRGASDLNIVRSRSSARSDNTAAKRVNKDDIKFRGMYSDREQPRGNVTSTSESFDLRSFVKSTRDKSSTAVAAKTISSIGNDRKRVLPQRKEKDDRRLEPVSRPVKISYKNEVRGLKATTNKNSERDVVKSGTASRMIVTNKRVELESDEESDDTGSNVSDNEPFTKRVTMDNSDVRAKENIIHDDERPKKIVAANDNQRIRNESVKEIKNVAVKNINNVTAKNMQSMKRVVYNSDFERDDDENESSEETDEDITGEESDSGDDDDVDNEGTDDESGDTEGGERSDSEASSQC